MVPGLQLVALSLFRLSYPGSLRFSPHANIFEICRLFTTVPVVWAGPGGRAV